MTGESMHSEGEYYMGGLSLLPKIDPQQQCPGPFWPHGGKRTFVHASPTLLEFVRTFLCHFHQITQTLLGTRTRAPRLAHQHYSIYTTNSLAESGPKSVSELKPDLGVASTFCPECSAPHIVLT